MASQCYYSHGKLLLTGEYLVLKGALALAVPLKMGQSLVVEKSPDKFMKWEACWGDNPWFSALIDPGKYEIIKTSDELKSQYLVKLLEAIEAINPAFKKEFFFKKISTQLEFNPGWGWGSSSTLINNLACWAGIDPYKLHFAVSNGSGYDIACAANKQALIYSLNKGNPVVEQISLNDIIVQEAYLIYLGNKMSSDQEVRKFSESSIAKTDIEDISAITKELCKVKSLADAMKLLQQHEKIMASVLGRTPVKEEYFPGFYGAVKSLGAWGGDFVMALSNHPSDYVLDYFQQKGKDTIFRLKEVML